VPADGSQLSYRHGDNGGTATSASRIVPASRNDIVVVLGFDQAEEVGCASRSHRAYFEGTKQDTLEVSVECGVVNLTTHGNSTSSKCAGSHNLVVVRLAGGVVNVTTMDSASLDSECSLALPFGDNSPMTAALSGGPNATWVRLDVYDEDERTAPVPSVFTVVEEALKYDEAVEYCQSHHGGRLADIYTEAEHSVIIGLIEALDQPEQEYILGGQAPEALGEWFWAAPGAAVPPFGGIIGAGASWVAFRDRAAPISREVMALCMKKNDYPAWVWDQVRCAPIASSPHFH